jgi:hypothetical protein
MLSWGTWALMEVAWTVAALLAAIFASIAQYEHYKNLKVMRAKGVNGATAKVALIVTIIVWVFLLEQIAHLSFGILAGLTPPAIRREVSDSSAYIVQGLLVMALLKCAAAGLVIAIYRYAIRTEMEH